MFDFTLMQFNRGTYNSQNSPLATTVHFYGASLVDTVDTIIAPGYFPVNFGLDATNAAAEVHVGDLITVVGSDSFATGKIVSLNPVSIDTSQDDVFPTGIRVNLIDGINPSDLMFIGNNQTSTITIGGATANVLMTQLICNDITNTGPGGTLFIHGVYDGKTLIGQDTASLTTGILTNRIDQITAGGPNPLKIGSASTTPLEIGKPATPVILKGGIKWDLTPDSGTISNYEEHNVSFNWTGPWAAPQPGSLRIQKVENVVYLWINKIPAAPATVAGQSITVSAIIPAFARPVSSVVEHALVIDNNVTVDGTVFINTSGTLFLNVGYAGGFFQALGSAGSNNISLFYDQTV